MENNGHLVKKYPYKTQGLIFLLLIALAAGLLCVGIFSLPNSDYSMENAGLDMTGYRRHDERMIYLSGEWEYFADKLIETDGLTNARPDGLVRLPVDFAGSGMAAPESGRASFRMTLYNVSPEARMICSIPGYLGEHKLFIGGEPFREGIAPATANYFPFVDVRDADDGVVEIIIELDQSIYTEIDRSPVLSEIDLQFNNFFLVRMVFFVMLGLLLSAFIILPITYNIFRQRPLRLYALIGCLALTAFLFETIWYYGVVGILRPVMSMTTMKLLCRLVEAAVVYCMCWFQMRVYDQTLFKRQRSGVNALFGLCAAAALTLAACGAPMRHVQICLFVCVAPGIILVGVMAVKSVLQYGRGALIAGIGNLAILSGLLFKNLCIRAEATLALQMVLPVCMAVNLVCWSLMIADSRRADIAALQKALDAEQTMAKTQAAFLASQIQPHFLYNTLTTIQELCYTDPMTAADTVVHFSNYLRQNIDFMDYKDKIPFPVELGHIDNYIDLQKIRFGDAVRFVQEIDFDRFVLPPLTVQPLIENAVSHGIRKNNARGTVKLAVARIEREIVIVVEDDGEGFDVEAVHSRSLENIRRRIEGAMCGSVYIDSKPGQGARITIRFPYKEGMLGEDRNR